MSSINFVFSFFVIGILFILFFLIIIILGYIILYTATKKKEEFFIKNPSVLFERFLISFGIGIVIFISYSYILNIFEFFNFFTAYLILLLIDICFLIYYLIKYRKILFSRKIILNYKRFFLKKNTLFSILIIIISYIIVFILYWNIITESIGLIRRDPYSYSENIYFLLDNEKITEYRLGLGYPSGYVIFTSGILLVFPNPLVVYLFIKMASLYYILFYIIVAFFILKDIFKKHYLVFFSLLLISISLTFIARNIINVPSSLATIIVSISFLLLIKNYPYYLLGFNIAAIYLIHPLTLFFYLPVLIIYLSIKFFSNIKNKGLILKGFFSISCMLIIVFILLIPYLLNYQDNIFDIYKLYDNFIDNVKYNINFRQIPQNNLKLGLLKIFNLDFLRNFINSDLLNRWDYAANESIDSYFITTFLGIFFSIYYRKKKIIIFNLCVISVLISFFLPHFILIGFLDEFKDRSLETFALPIIIMATFFFESILELAKRLTNYLILKSRFYSSVIHKYKPFSNILKVDMILLLLIFTSFYFVKIERNDPFYYYYYEEDNVEIILYLRNNIESESIIFRPDLERTEIYSILYDMKFYDYNFSSFSDVGAFFHYMWHKHTDYLIVKNSDIPEQWKKHIFYNTYFRELVINLTEFSLYRVPY